MEPINNNIETLIDMGIDDMLKDRYFLLLPDIELGNAIEEEYVQPQFSIEMPKIKKVINSEPTLYTKDNSKSLLKYEFNKLNLNVTLRIK